MKKRKIGGTPSKTKKTKKKSMKGRLTKHQMKTPPPPPSPPKGILQTLSNMLFGPPPPPSSTKSPSPKKKSEKKTLKAPTPPKKLKTPESMKKNPNYKKLQDIIAKELNIVKRNGKYLYVSNKEESNHNKKTKNLYKSLYV